MTRPRKLLLPTLALLACLAIVGVLVVAVRPGLPASLGLTATKLTPNAQPAANDGTPIADTLSEQASVDAAYDFSARLLQAEAAGQPHESVLVSPLSALFALSLAENGAEGETLSQMEAATGLDAQELTGYLAAYRRRLSGEGLYDPRVGGSALPLACANSVWLRDSSSLSVRDEFLATCAGELDAEVFSAPFDSSTCDDINAWVDANTDHMMPEIIDKIPGTAMLYLVNALAFEGTWEEPYESADVDDAATFTTEEGVEQNASMMYSQEGSYLENDLATGFVRPYEDHDFAFVALLPQEGVSLAELLDGLDGAALRALLEPVPNTEVHAGLPKFSLSFETELSEQLQGMGITAAFDPAEANFSRMGTCDDGNLFIASVMHKTYIDVDEKGTRAAATTSIGMEVGASAPSDGPVVQTVILDRPFAYSSSTTRRRRPSLQEPSQASHSRPARPALHRALALSH